MPSTRMMIGLAVAVVVTWTLSKEVGVTLGAQDTCLHGSRETQFEKLRRQDALWFLRRINTAEARAGSQSGYKPVSQLGLGEPPAGFSLDSATEGQQYVALLVDATDPCR